MTERRGPGAGWLRRPVPGPDRVTPEDAAAPPHGPGRRRIRIRGRRRAASVAEPELRRVPARQTCLWCGRSGRGVVPLVAGRAERTEVVGAICDDCVLPDDAESPAGPLLLLTTAAVAVATLWVASAPGSPSRVFSVAAAAAWAAVVLAYGVRAARAGWTTRHRGLAGLRSWRWAVPPLVGALTASLVIADVPLRARFTLSRGAIEHAVDQAVHAEPPSGRVGAFSGVTVSSAAGVTAVRVSGGCGFFKTAAPGTTLPALGKPVDLGGGWRAGCLPSAP